MPIEVVQTSCLVGIDRAGARGVCSRRELRSRYSLGNWARSLPLSAPAFIDYLQPTLSNSGSSSRALPRTSSRASSVSSVDHRNTCPLELVRLSTSSNQQLETLCWNTPGKHPVQLRRLENMFTSLQRFATLGAVFLASTADAFVVPSAARAITSPRLGSTAVAEEADVASDVSTGDLR